MKLILIAGLTSIIPAVNALGQGYYGIDGNGNFYFGRFSENGSYSGVDGNGKFHHGRINDDGSYSGVDGNGKFYHGRIDR